MMQLEGYKPNRYLKWLSESNTAYNKDLRNIFIFILIITFIHLFTIITSIYERNIGTLIPILYMVIWTLSLFLSGIGKEDKPKKPLAFTNRAKRLFAANIILTLILASIFVYIYITSFNAELSYLPFVLFIYALIYFFQSYTICLSNIIVNPLELSINRYYYIKAQDKIRSFDKLKVVGITGSFGKTSTKFITAAILKQKYRVLETPESYNTPMGISKVINESLEEKHQVFVAEMGARNIGDIKELAMLVKPSIAVITSIGPTHLETFKNIDNIMKAKYEIVEELPADGLAILNYDNKYIRKLADKTFKEKILYGMKDIERLDIYAEDIEVDENGSSFTIKDKEGHSIRCTTRLLGKHNIYNILAGVCVAYALGLSFCEIKKGIEKIEPIPHRLNLIKADTGITIIDDSFNSNPIGAKAALEVLGQFKGGRKIIVTPGMVELGEVEKKVNREFGMDMAKVCDYAILVGKNITAPIYEGLKKAGFSENNIFIVDDLDQATEKIQEIARPEDIILFENDLPDNYYK